MARKILAAILVLLWAAGSAPAQEMEGFDVLAGTGTAGPYLLSWAGIEPGSDRVSAGGLQLFRLLDYTLDYQAGKITFARPLGASEVVHVSYRRLPSGKPQSAGFSIPFSISMGSLLGADVQMSYLLQAQGANQQAVVLGMQAERQGRMGQLTSSLLVSQAQSGQGEDPTRALGLKLAGKTSFRRGSLAASLLRAEEGFAGGSRYGLTPGAQVLNLAGEYLASRALKTTAAFARQDDVTGKTNNKTKTYSLTTRYQPDRTLGAGVAFTRQEQVTGGVTTTTRTAVYDLALALPEWPSLSASRTTTLTEREGTAGSNHTITDQVALNARVGSVSTAASHKIVRTDAGDTTTTRFDLSTPLVSRVASLKAGYSETDGAASTSSASATLALTPLAGTQIEALVGQDKRPGQEVDIAGVKATVKPSDQVALAGSYKRRDYGDSELATTTANATFTPLPRLRLATEYSENPEDTQTGQPVAARAAKVELSTQLGDLGLGGSYGRRKEATGNESRLSEMTLSLALSARQRLYTGYRLTDSLQPQLASDTRLYKVGYTRHAGSTFSLSLEAQLLEHRENNLLLTGRTERRAEAKLNAQF